MERVRSGINASSIIEIALVELFLDGFLGHFYAFGNLLEGGRLGDVLHRLCHSFRRLTADLLSRFRRFLMEGRGRTGSKRRESSFLRLLITNQQRP